MMQAVLMDRVLLAHESQRVHQVGDLFRIFLSETDCRLPLNGGWLIPRTVVNGPAHIVTSSHRTSKRMMVMMRIILRLNRKA